MPSSHTLDFIVCCHLSTSVASMVTAMKDLHRLLKPGGTIILLEPRQESPTAMALYGTCPSWWRHGAVDRTTKDDAGPRNWHSCLEETGFVDIVDMPYISPATADAEEDVGDPAVHLLLIAKSPQQASVSPERSPPVPILLIRGDTTREIQGNPSLSGLAALLRGFGHQVTTTSTLEDADPAGKINPTEEEFRALQDLFLKSRGVLFIIRGTRSYSPVLNMVVGMIRTVRSEIGESRLLVLDVEDKADRTISDPDVVKAVGALFEREFLAGNVASPSATGASDTEFRLWYGRLMVPRLIPDKAASRDVMAASEGQDNGTPTPQEEVWTQPGRLLRAEISTPGLLDTIHFVNDNHHPDAGLAANSVEIEVKAVGLNSRDVMMAMGQTELEALGAEASGVVTAVGDGMHERFAVGDRVACLHLGTIRSFVRGDSRFVQKLPPDMGFDTGAALPGAYTTSKHYCCFCCCCCYCSRLADHQCPLPLL
ncbi:Putative GroES-like superfamily, polyketide synthase, enoylreductase domain-containing protein [Colletotrichum destructivum]|uniref:GroES-like superfamily, polyketide synthase, enoylreductase domain-containing protein n=1 Tax=Colletotrichum destructivum TaxID=34406 RepID=A0AAX4HW44_9PEZI|nr:Putative GroES-like superfamily, polyketide synthase, enoylreductase domain-containing protein [Colletotrichum destructivum]